MIKHNTKKLLVVTLSLFCLLMWFSCNNDDDDNNDDSGAAYGNIFVESEPAGAHIYLDGNDTGMNTPVTIYNVAVGIHAVRLTLAGYHDWTGQADVREGQTYQIYAIMVPEDQPTPTPTQQPDPTPTNTPGTGQLPNLHAISVQTSGDICVSFIWENNGPVAVTVPFGNIVYVYDASDSLIMHWAHSVNYTVNPGQVITTSANKTMPSNWDKVCARLDTEDQVEESDESYEDNIRCAYHP